MTAAIATPGIGHNQPPSDVELLRDRLDARYASLVARRDELIQSAGRAPDSVTDDEGERRMTEFARQLSTAASLAEAARKQEKAPLSEQVKLVDGFFQAIAVPLIDAKKRMLDRLTIWQRKKAEAERQRREAEERASREAAEVAAAAASTDGELQDAIDKEALARDAAKAAEASTVDLSRARGDMGAVSSLRTRWTFAVEDLAKVPAEFLALDEVKVRGAIKAGQRAIPGLRIFQESHTVVR